MKKSLLIGAIVGSILLFSAMTFIKSGDILGGQIARSDGYGVATTNSSTTISAGSSNTVLAANNNRIYARVTNQSSVGIWCSNSLNSAVARSGLLLLPSSTLEFGSEHIPSMAAIKCWTEGSATSTVGIYEN